MSEQDRFEDDLLHALTRTGEGFRAEQAPLVTGGLVRGRRRWRRRSAAAVVGGAAALALVGTGTVYLSGAGGTAPAAAAIGAAAGPASSGAASAVGARTSGGTPTGTGSPSASAETPVVTGDEVLATLKALLPQGVVTDGSGRGTDDPSLNGTFASADLVFDDGRGRSLIQVGIQKHRKGQGQPRTCPENLVTARLDACSVIRLADGSELALSQGYEYADGRADTKEWSATLSGPDGRSVTVSEWNAPKEKGAPDSRPNPPLTLDQLKAVVTDGSWDRIVAAVRYDGVDTEAVRSGLSLQEREALLTGLLPAGAGITARSGDELAATFTVTNGPATGTVILRVEDYSQQDAARQQLFKDADTLADGTRVVVRPGPQPSVETLHPNGARVMVAAVSGTKSAATGGEQPVLTLEQVKAVAVSPEWKLGK
ncbi:hypothetical protein ACFVVX_35495 [Kitasatospora sp. NPDC058170]|uniref:hypothetical protein n=1 Tax=Kitasatospora sp. NPDC058170 TaxID=3346364 RepID=UPI0036DB8F79